MATPDVITDTTQEGSCNTYTIRPNFQHKYVTVYGYYDCTDDCALKDC